MTEKAKGFEFLEHTADVYIAAYGRDLAEAFENAASAMFETMTDTENVKPEVEEIVEAEGHDKQALFYSWLEELLIRFEVNDRLYSRFHVQKIVATGEGFKLEAKVYGEPFNRERHKQKVGVKAVTYHRMEIKEAPEEVTIKFILDI
ncbi:MAG: archease [Candidatus Bathyarchaeota archaeon]|nr:archease [Candidatus Bathyarchaeota archaeon]